MHRVAAETLLDVVACLSDVAQEFVHTDIAIAIPLGDLAGLAA